MRKVKWTVPVLMTEPTLCPPGWGGEGHWRPKENIKRKVCIFIKGEGKKRERKKKNRLKAVIKGYRDGGRKAARSLWSEVITTRGLEWKRQGKMMARIRPGWRVSTGLRASSESPINQSCQPPGPPSIWLGKVFTWSKSQEIFSTDFRAIDLMDSFGTAIRKCWLGQWGGGGGWEESPSPQHAFCFMAACPHLRGKVDREAVFLLAWNK